MTNAEVIETLRANYPDACYEQLREAVDAAIEALKAQDAAGDAISRQAAIERLKKYRKVFCKNHIEFTILSDEDKARVDEIDNAIATLINLPSAQPEIIRCKDCKWKNNHNCTRAVEVWIDDNKYCAWAERRTDE